ncbi:ImmA/IrrE family metallo-endopeptidase [Brevibacillus laterosporus]|uniref:ImmA/IrrE family metallo-endopeptidase n=1 Tax=Brevibacillus laterosporus TaxID=1465 RepID=UPI003D202D97
MIFPRFARYHKVMSIVHSFFLKEQINNFPLDPFKIIENNQWGLISYTELATIHNTTIENVKRAYQSEDGYTMYDAESFTIAYNDKIETLDRIRFTLMHEIGHIYLNHLIDFDETILARSKLTKNKYKIMKLIASQETHSPPLL